MVRLRRGFQMRQAVKEDHKITVALQQRISELTRSCRIRSAGGRRQAARSPKLFVPKLFI
jgi:hypothetical protein